MMLVHVLVLGPIAAAMAAFAASLLHPRAGAPASLASSLAAVTLSTLLFFLAKGAGGELFYGELWVNGFTSCSLLLVALVYMLSSLSSLSLAPERSGRSYYSLLNAAYAVMMLCTVSNNIFMFWILLELSTILTIYLVAVEGERTSVEASWKYYVMCSVGMAFSLYGFILLYSLGHRAGVEAPWLLSSLASSASRLTAYHGELVLAALFLSAGLAVKTGLFPVHMWLPDAHSEAPTPVSALLSGALIYLPVYVLLRVLEPFASALGPVPLALAVLGLASMVYAAAGMYSTRHVKRMLAYSSIEHMGVLVFAVSLALGLGAKNTALAGFVVHSLGHALAKAAAFIAAGILVAMYATHELTELRGVAAVDRIAGGGLVALLVFLMGIPPSPLFLSELLVCFSAARSLPLLIAYLLALLACYAALAARIRGLLEHHEHHTLASVKGMAAARVAVVLGIILLLALLPLTPLLVKVAVGV